MKAERQANKAAIAALESRIATSVEHLTEARGDKHNKSHHIIARGFSQRGWGLTLGAAISDFLTKNGLEG